MKRLLSMGVLAWGTLSCGGGPQSKNYGRNDFQLVTAFTAKEYCSCRFVMGMDNVFCAAWTRQSPEVAGVEVDEKAKVVRAHALTFWNATARYVNEREGCLLE